MQAERNKILTIMLVVLVTITAIILWFRSNPRRPEADRQLFSDYDVKAVDLVRLASSRDTVTLQFTGSRWTMDNQYLADPGMIEVLFATLLQAVPKRPVAVARQDSVAKMLKDRGTHITLSSSGAVVASFTAGGNSARTQAYFLRDDNAVPYLMTIPGYRVYVSGIFELAESGWRDKRIFAFNWRNFQRLEATFPATKDEDFSIALNDQFFTVQGMAAVDTSRLNDYLDDVSLLSADEYVAPGKSLDSLTKTRPAMTIAVQDVGGRTYSLNLFPYTDKQGRVAGLVNGNQWAMFARDRVVSVSRPRRHFEAKPR
jgi:hypothetical protein